MERDDGTRELRGLNEFKDVPFGEVVSELKRRMHGANTSLIEEGFEPRYTEEQIESVAMILCELRMGMAISFLRTEDYLKARDLHDALRAFSVSDPAGYHPSGHTPGGIPSGYTPASSGTYGHLSHDHFKEA